MSDRCLVCTTPFSCGMLGCADRIYLCDCGRNCCYVQRSDLVAYAEAEIKAGHPTTFEKELAAAFAQRAAREAERPQ
jgi:hypothetical protein